MRRAAISLVLAMMLVASFASQAMARGISPARLAAAGWTCFDVPGLGVHCMAPGDSWGSPTVQLLYFDTTSPTDADADFLGTESLIRADLYNGQPCPTQGLDDYFLIPPLGYYACHRQ